MLQRIVVSLNQCLRVRTTNPARVVQVRQHEDPQEAAQHSENSDSEIGSAAGVPDENIDKNVTVVSTVVNTPLETIPLPVVLFPMDEIHEMYSGVGLAPAARFSDIDARQLADIVAKTFQKEDRPIDHVGLVLADIPQGRLSIF
jgi:hypothetical protein